MSFPTGLESLNYPLIYISHILGSHEKCPFSLCEKNKCKLTLFVLQKPFSRREDSVVYGWVYISHDSSSKTALTNMNFIWVHFGNPEFAFWVWFSGSDLATRGARQRRKWHQVPWLNNIGKYVWNIKRNISMFTHLYIHVFLYINFNISVWERVFQWFHLIRGHKASVNVISLFIY